LNRSDKKLENVERIKAYGDFHDIFLILPHFSCKLVLPLVQVIDTLQIGELRLKFRDFCSRLLEISLEEVFGHYRMN
jgi:hypothetical protein